MNNFSECQRKYDPPNGKIKCESKKYALDSKCYLICDDGFIPYDQSVTKCLYDKKTDDYVWDIDDIRLQCVRAIGLIIGGVQANYEYTNQVEVFAPGMTCTSAPPPFPSTIVGTVSGFVNGLNIVCGGGKMEYVDCSKHPVERSNDCDTDLDCVHTSGGARWCTGPKVKKCYTLYYDIVTSKEVNFAIMIPIFHSNMVL